MKPRERGFKAIKIEDPNAESQNTPFIDITNIKFLICLIIIGTIILVFLVYKFFYLLAQAEQDSDYNQKNGKLKNYNLRNRKLNYTDTNITYYTNSNNTLEFNNSTNEPNITNFNNLTITNEIKIENINNNIVNDKVISVYNNTTENKNAIENNNMIENNNEIENNNKIENNNLIENNITKIDNNTNEKNITQIDINTNENNNIKLDNHTNEINNSQIVNHTNEINNTQIDNHTNEINNTQFYNHTNEINNTQIDNHTNENSNTQVDNHTNEINNTQTDNHTNQINNTQMDNHTNQINNTQMANHTNENNNTKVDNYINEINNKSNTNNSNFNLQNITNIDNMTNKYDVSKIYDNYSSFEEVKNPKISIIIIVKEEKNDKNFEIIENILKNIYEQNFREIEIIFVDDFKINNNLLIYKEIKKFDKRIKTLEYEEKIGNLKKIINGANHASAEYLLFMDSSGKKFFKDNNAFELMYNKYNETKTDIIELEPFPNLNKIIYQPELFDYMYFGKDDFNQMKLFCLEKILIKRELFINVTDSIDNYYKEQNINHYEEFMFIFLLLKKAQSFEYLKLKTDGNIAKRAYGFIPDLKDFLLYMKFMMEYSGNNVPEKRMIAGIFMKELINRRNYHIGKEDYNLTKEVIDKFVTCNKISDYEEKQMREFQQRLY